VDDAAILREIARRIREGIDRTTSDDTEASPPEAPPPADQSPEQERLARLAHELKSPLSAMVAAAEMMAQQRLGPMENPQYLGYANDIATSGRHALTVVDRVLNGLRQPEAPAALDFVLLDLNAIVERTVSVLRPLVRERSQTLRTELQRGLPHLIADATSLRQILLNLLNNAAKYANTGSEITISTSAALDGPITLEVADVGPGMSAAELAAALGKASDRHAARGTGLGLPLVRELAAANGATMDVESASGSGTRIRLTFAKDKVVPM
jgi:signal transduction histidine kinase